MRALYLVFLIAITSNCGQTTERGSAGKDGAPGVTGATGPAGQDGKSCSLTNVPANSAAPNGGSLIKCPDGSQALILNGTNGIDGAKGSDGKDGANGSDGTNGINGTPGTLVQATQFCRDVTPSYPNAFPEVGFCINKILYAVYSTNGGFMTEIPPGTYRSDAVGSKCDFTVGLNCQIIN